MPHRPAPGSLLLLAAVGAACVLAACERPPGAPQGDAEALAHLQRAREVHGAAVLDRAEVSFVFRGVPFTLWRDGPRFRYARTTTDSTGAVTEDIVDNDGAHRRVDGREVALTPDEAAALATAVNSVAYFALLPHPLADAAVRARSLAPDTLRGEPYHRVEVTFAQDGGGADWRDRYVYWLHAARGTLDYLAYTYEPDAADTSRTETGSRFREVLRVQSVGGVRVQDYRNWTADSVGTEIERYGALFSAGRTFQVSDVVLDSVRVRPL
jgi:hypothetical protein